MDLVNIVISYTKDFAVAITHNGEPEDDDADHFEINGISLHSFKRKWSREIQGKSNRNPKRSQPNILGYPRKS